MHLSPLEADILGDMSWDSHGVGELVGFIRSANPALDDAGVFRETRALLASWIGRGWLQLGPEHRPRAGLTSIDQLLPFLDRQGPSVVSIDSEVELPEVDLAEQTYQDVPWLRDAG